LCQTYCVAGCSRSSRELSQVAPLTLAMAEGLDTLLTQTEEPSTLSFYGLDKKLKEVEQFLEKAEAAALMKAPTAETTRLVESKDDIFEAQGRLRKAMVQRIDQPQLIKREQPIAEDFVENEIKKAKDRGGDKDKMDKVIARLKAMQELIRSTPPVPVSRQVKDAEAAIKDFQAEYEKLAPIHEKWEAGRHSFKTNADLQDHKKRFDACSKGRVNAKPMLEEILCRSFDVGAAKAMARAEAKAEQLRRDGWGPVAKKAPVPAAKSASAKRPPPPKKMSFWDAADVPLAQRLRAEAAAAVRAGVEKAEDDGEQEEAADEEEDEEEEVVEAKAPPLVRPKPPPPLPPQAAAGLRSRQPVKAVEQDDEDDEFDDAPSSASAPKGSVGGSASSSSISAKRKGKSAKKQKADASSNATETDAPAATKEPSTITALINAAETAIRGSVLQELLRPASWKPAVDDAAADERLAELVEGLPWANPIGLSVHMTWREFAELEVDGGPKGSSKRNESPVMQRLGVNVPYLFAHYATLIFFFMLLEAVANFSLLMWAVALQVILMLLPPEVLPQVPRPMHVMALQMSHLIVWLFVVRSFWVMHFFVKVFCVMVICGHAYIVVPPESALSAS